MSLPNSRNASSQAWAWRSLESTSVPSISKMNPAAVLPIAGHSAHLVPNRMAPVIFVCAILRGRAGRAPAGEPPALHLYNPPPKMRTERGFSPEPADPRRRQFLIAGEQTILRALEPDDLERCYRWMNDPEIVRTLKHRYPIAFHSEAEWLERAVNPPFTERHFAVERRDDRTHIGNASIHDIDWVSRAAGFGLFIGEPSAWNKGFGSDAIRAVVRFAFEEMNLQKLRINVFDDNERAKHVLLANGFVQEGKLAREFFREG